MRMTVDQTFPVPDGYSVSVAFSFPDSTFNFSAPVIGFVVWNDEENNSDLDAIVLTEDHGPILVKTYEHITTCTNSKYSWYKK